MMLIRHNVDIVNTITHILILLKKKAVSIHHEIASSFTAFSPRNDS